MRTVNEISKISGVSVRTLHYYDEIGLLKPTEVTNVGYRLYDDEAVKRLQNILLFRELKFSLKQIKEIINNDSFDRNKALKEQINLLTLQKKRTEDIINLARSMLERNDNMSFKEFDKTKIESYKKEAKKRWGKTDAFKEFEEKEKDRDKKAQSDIVNGLMDYFVQFGKITDKDANCAEAQHLAQKLQSYISENFYNCTNVIFLSLADMYSAKGEMKDNIDKAGGKGTADFASRAIKIFCENK